MLIYAKRNVRVLRSHEDNQDDSSIKRPSSGVLRVIQDLNDTHSAACERYLEKSVFITPNVSGATENHCRKKVLKTIFADLTEKVKSIYGKWSVTTASVCCFDAVIPLVNTRLAEIHRR